MAGGDGRTRELTNIPIGQENLAPTVFCLMQESVLLIQVGQDYE